jgi:threonine synthase
VRIQDYKGLIERYRIYLPVSKRTPVVTLWEGNTPLIFAPEISQMLGKDIEVYLKYEGLNPTASFKDRGMTLAVSKAKEEGQKAVICASTGNTSASASAYAVRAGLKSVVLIPQGAIALGKLAQALIHGACVVPIKGNFDDAFRLVRDISDNYPVRLVNSVNPHRIEGQKTAAFEVCDVLKRQPDIQSMPVGNAGNITAYWKGYNEYKSMGKIDDLPVVCGFQAKGSAPIVLGRPVKNPRTLATAIRIGNPASWKQALAARDESRGLIDTVTDREIIKAYKLLSQNEGVFVEPASAASIAGLFKLKDRNFFSKIKRRKSLKDKKIRVVCILTGHGLKDPEIAIKNIRVPKSVAADREKIVKILKLDKR